MQETTLRVMRLLCVNGSVGTSGDLHDFIVSVVSGLEVRQRLI